MATRNQTDAAEAAGRQPGSAAIGAKFGRLVREARAGSRQARGELLDGCRRYMLLVAGKALDSDLRPKAGASDLVQDTFVEAYREFDKFQGTTERELFAWLTKILSYRLANNARRYRHTQKRTVHREVPLAPDLLAELLYADGSGETPSAYAAACEEEAHVRAAMERLPQRYREVIVQRTWQRKSFLEVGLGMACSAEAARKLWGRAVERLAHELNGPFGST